jgi:hypothetical protein
VCNGAVRADVDVLVQMWGSPGADVGHSWCRCGAVLVQMWGIPGQMWGSPGADVGQ